MAMQEVNAWRKNLLLDYYNQSVIGFFVKFKHYEPTEHYLKPFDQFAPAITSVAKKFW